MIRIVLDTNLIVSGLLWRGLPGNVMIAMLAGRFTPVVTSETLAEISDVLRREKFAARLAASRTTAEDFVHRYAQIAVLVEPGRVPSSTVRDVDDHSILACAVGGHADFIVTGDRDLLDLGSYAGIPILTPAAFLDTLDSHDRD